MSAVRPHCHPRPRRRRLHRPGLALAVGAAMLEILEPRTLLAGVEMLKDIDPTTRFLITPKNLTDVNGTLYFTAQSKLWRSDGTAPGTFKITDDFGDAANLVNFNGTLFF